MPSDDLDHEVIDSPEALFRHLYEAHGVAEALDLDPATAPLKFWLRRHSDLEQTAGRSPVDGSPASPHHDGVDAAQPPPAPRSAARAPGPAGASSGQAPAPGGASRGPGPTPAGASPEPASVGGRPPIAPGPRFRPFSDPLVEAVASALVGRGLDERQVRRGLSTYAGAGGRHGEEAVRAAFISPMLEAIAALLSGEPARRIDWPPPRPATTPDPAAWRNGRQPEPSPPAPTPRAPSPQASPTRGRAPREPAPLRAAARDPAPRSSARAEPAEPAPDGSTPRETPAWTAGGADLDGDFMAIADVLQERRRPRRGGRGDAPTRAAGAEAAADGDDFMALADALQRRRDRGGQH